MRKSAIFRLFRLFSSVSYSLLDFSDMRISWKIKLKLAALVLIAGWLAMAGREAVSAQGREFHQTYDLAPNGTVSLTNLSGNIRITTWNENRVSVDAIKQGRSDEELDQVEIQVTARPDRIEIRTIYRSDPPDPPDPPDRTGPPPPRRPRGPRGRWSGVSVDYDLKVPRTAALSPLNSTSGNITVIGPVARLIARSTSGNVTVQDVTETATVASTSGNVRAERIGGELRATSTSGNVIIDDVGSRLFAQSTSGSVTANRIRDDATLSATSGNVKLERVGGRAVARSSSGWVTVSDAGGDVQANSNSDNVTVTGVRGRVTANTISGNIVIRQADDGVRASGVSGRIEVSDAKGRIEVNTTSDSIVLNNIDSRDIQARSTSGSIRFTGKFYDDGHYEFESFSSDVLLILPPDSNFTLTTKSHSGSVNTEFPLKLDRIPSGPNRGYVAGTVGKGGAEVRAASFSGNVIIKRNTGQVR